jgi:hypothetical protein
VVSRNNEQNHRKETHRMNMLNVNLSQYKDRFGQTVPPGRYTVVVDDLEQTNSKAGNPMVNLWFRIIEGPSEGATVVDRVTVTEKALFRVVAFMQAIGQPTPRRNLQVNLNTWMGKRLQIDVEDGEPYNGRVRSEVRGYMRVEGSGVETAVSDLSDDLPAEAETQAASAETADPWENASTGSWDESTGPIETALMESAPIEDAPVADRVMAAAGKPQTLSLDDIDL